jgi:nitrate reductase (NAD(P)H)
VEDVKMVSDKVSRIIEFKELREHDSEEQPWFVVNGEVYDGTPFLGGHPGGSQSIISAAGQDVTDEFVGIRMHRAHFPLFLWIVNPF